MKRWILFSSVVLGLSQGTPLGAVTADRALESVQITHYTLVTEASTSGQHTGDRSTVTDPPDISGTYSREFLYSGWGVPMQGSGIAKNGKCIKFVSGGGGWGPHVRWLKNPSTAVFRESEGVTGSSGRLLVENYSIAVDPRVIPLGRYVWIDSEKRWFRADDTGGKIRGRHIDIYAGGSDSVLAAGSSRVYVTRTRHASGDPGPYGRASVPAAPAIHLPYNGATIHSNAVRLSWSAVRGADFYSVQVDRGGSVVAEARPTGAGYGVTLSPGLYRWQVRAHNSAGWSKPASATFTIASGSPPETPVIHSPSNGATVTSRTVSLTWSAVSGVDTYFVQVYRNASPVARGWPTTAGYKADLPRGVYVWYVWAHNSAGWSRPASAAFTVR